MTDPRAPGPAVPASLSRTFTRLLHHQWQHGGWLSNLLLPLSWLAGAVVARRRARAPAPEPLGIPVVVVGNIYVGGTGKTPLILALIEALRARGWQPGVVSRGYGVAVGPEPRVGQGPQVQASAFGDEPALIAHSTGVPVAVHPNRPAAVNALRRAYPHVDVILSDDGLQHLPLARTVEIVVQDARGIGNGRLLPAGPLREPASRLDQVDVVVTNLTSSSTPPQPSPVTEHPRHITMQLVPTGAVRLHDGLHLSLAQLAAQAPRMAAAAGIGQPQRFFDTLRAAGIMPIATHALPDHYDWQHSPFTHDTADALLVTAKDAVKCGHLHDSRLWAVGVTAQLSDPHFFDWLHQRLTNGQH